MGVLTAKRTFDKSYFIAWVIAILLFLAVTLVAYQIRQTQINTLNQILKGQSDRTRSQIIYNAQELTSDLASMVNRWLVNEGTQEINWRSDARNFIERTPGVNEIWWIDQNLKVRWSETLLPLHHVDIQNIISQPGMTEKLALARQDNLPEFSHVVNTDDGYNIIFILMPIVYDNDFDGFFAIEIYIDDFIERILDDPLNTGFYTKAYAGEKVVYTNGPELTKDSYLEYFELNLDADTDGWVFKVYPTENLAATILSPLPYVVFAGGFLIVVMLLLTLLSRHKAKQKSLQLGVEIKHREKIQQKLSYLANHDALTHLPNRHFITEYIEKYLADSEKAATPFSLLFIDLDHFKDVNDTLGHAMGDRLLMKLPELFAQIFRKQDIIARMGGDEFIVLLPGKMAEESIITLVGRFMKQLKYPVDIEGHQIRLTGSVGVAMYPRDGTTVNELLSNADAALYRAKDKGRNTYAIYDSVIEHKAQARLKLVNQLHEAQEQQRFEMFYQPRYDCQGNMVGAEALMRWLQQDGDYQKPKTFIELLEDTGLIVSVSWQLFSQSLQNFKILMNNHKNIILSFNVSAKLLEHPEFLNRLQYIVDEQQFPYDRLELELTEQTLIQDVENSQFILNQLTAWGINVAIDDFGTGYSSLSYLKNFPVHALKIDKSFIRDMNEDEDDLELVKTMIIMGQNLNITTVAEGVETQAQLRKLMAMGCDQYQGFLFSHPISFTELQANINQLSNSPLMNLDGSDGLN
ncbi:MAG: EAL domain-containing protein [Proteobacteria bacterium]|nr:MAG: EAL domain-containing protein [Pseudomonadota bacterium]